jgi:hypothetical protein
MTQRFSYKLYEKGFKLRFRFRLQFISIIKYIYDFSLSQQINLYIKVIYVKHNLKTNPPKISVYLFISLS